MIRLRSIHCNDQGGRMLLLSIFACTIQSSLADPPDAPTAKQALSNQRFPGEDKPSGTTVFDAFPPPVGATRVTPDGFGVRLQQLKLRGPLEPVRTHDGRAVAHRARVIELPLVKGDLQQCADSALRLRAEYLRDEGLEVVFHATSGDPMPWARYRDGERAYAVGNSLKWKSADPASWDRYLTDLFMWAGTASLAERDTVPDRHPDPGDVMVQPGFPGHAILLLDVATKGEQTFVLVGEGYMPAQDFHIELGDQDGWWLWQDGVQLGHWDMPASALRTWK